MNKDIKYEWSDWSQSKFLYKEAEKYIQCNMLPNYMEVFNYGVTMRILKANVTIELPSSWYFARKNKT